MPGYSARLRSKNSGLILGSLWFDAIELTDSVAEYLRQCQLSVLLSFDMLTVGSIR